MFAYLKGLLAAIHPTFVIVEVQGVGYSLSIPCRVLGELPAIGQPIQFYTSFVVRELSHTLYGFLQSQERDIFEVLMNVTGIGPKLALSLIGHLTWEEIQSAVTHQSIPDLCRVPGVGKKTAERLIVELKDKLSQFSMMNTRSLPVSVLTPPSQNAHDAILALVNLGYTQNIAQQAVKQSLKELPEEADLALLVTQSLKNI